MIQNVANASVPAPSARRIAAADADHTRTARPQPAADSDGAVVDLDHGKDPVAIGGFGLDLAYSRQVTRHARGQSPQVVAQQSQGLSLEFRFATRALPRGEDGEVNVEALANTDEKNALADSIQRMAEQGLRDPGALASFVNAVGDLFGEYERDLGMSEGDLAKAKQTFVDEVKSFFAQADGPLNETVTPTGDALIDPLPEGFESLDAALNGLRERLTARRHDVLTAAGDLSKVLAELTAAAEDAPKDTDTEKKAAGRLGDYLHGMKDALARRSTRELRDGARQRLLETDAQITERAHRSPPTETATTLGRNFLQLVHAN
jgi:hypothetical protein